MKDKLNTRVLESEALGLLNRFQQFDVFIEEFEEGDRDHR